MQTPFLLILLLISIRLKFSTGDETNPHRHLEKLDAQGKYILEWEVNWELREVSFEVTAETKGYVGFGLSAKGFLEGADIVVGGVGLDGQPYFMDLHGVSNATTEVDQSQDWQLHSFWENGTHTSLNFSRKIETCDDNDVSIGDDLLTLIWAMGETDDYNQWHDPCDNCYGHFPVYLLEKYLTPRFIQEARINNQELGREQLGGLKMWTISRRQRVPEKLTTYWCSFTKGPTLQKKHHLVGFNYRLESREAFKHTHHLILFKCRAPTGANPVSFFDPFVKNTTGEECYFIYKHTGQLPTQYCTEVKYGYGVGQRMFFLPNEMGIPFGESPDEYYLLQVHYDNPELLSGIEYEINIDLYYTDKLRPHDGALMTVGHAIPGIPSILVPPNTAEHSIYGHCGSNCTKRLLPQEGIHVVATTLHTHKAGQRVQLKHFRGDVELPWISNDDNYDNGFQTVKLLREPVNILPGDHLVTRCVYKTNAGNGSVVGGLSTSQEMCFVYVWYYNKLEGGFICRSEISPQKYLEGYLGVSNMTWDPSQVDFVVTSPSHLSGVTVTQVANNYVNWTLEKRRQLQMDHTFLPQANECAGGGNPKTSSGSRYSVNTPVGVKEYVPPSGRKDCGKPRIISNNLG